MQNGVNVTQSPEGTRFRLENKESSGALGDFTTTWSVIPLMQYKVVEAKNTEDLQTKLNEEGRRGWRVVSIA